MNFSEFEQEVIQINKWNELTSFLSEWFYEPDLDALRIILSTFVAHQYLSSPAVWIFVVGVPGSGKTSIGIRSLQFLKHTYTVTDVTPSLFMSGFKGAKGILQRLTEDNNGNGVVLWQDFTTFLTKPYMTRDSLLGDMRTIYDGEHSKPCGNLPEPIKWAGKCTMVAAVTPVLEDYWAVSRELGERFMSLNWKHGDPEISARYAAKQIGNEDYIKKEFARLVQQYVNEDNLKPVEVDWKESAFTSIATLVAALRVTVKRDPRRDKIISVSKPEQPTRIHSALMQIARANATLQRKHTIDIEDIRLAKRLAVDTIPANRAAVVRCLLRDHSYEMRAGAVKEAIGVSKLTFQRLVDELREMKIIDTFTVAGEAGYLKLRRNIVDMWEAGVNAQMRALENEDVDNFRKNGQRLEDPGDPFLMDSGPVEPSNSASEDDSI